jgi:multimeric flavodoxin WrbA
MDSTGLILNTLADGTIAHQLQSKLASEKVNAEVIDTSGMKISHCIGCNYCFLKTPGVCAIKDDYEQILKKLAHSDMAWLISDTHFGFINSNGKKVMDRVLPLLNMGLEFREG